MKLLKNNWYYFLTAIVILLVFKNWFMPGIIAGGDFIYAYPSMFENRSLIPFVWDWSGNNGLGSFAPPLQWVNTVYALPILFFGAFLHFPWSSVERLGFFFPYLLIGLFSSWYLAKILFRKSRFLFLVPLLYLTNTYALMMSGGGQIVGVGLAYAIAPMVLARFILLQNQLFEKKNNLRNAILFALSFAFVTLFDIRFAYIVAFTLFGYFLFHVKTVFSFRNVLYLFVIPSGLTVLLHAFWLLPLLLVHQAPIQSLDAAYNSTTAVSFFSFAKFENTISLLHPYWPENIFGKVSFMKPEFLMMPLLAFISLFFISQKRRDESQIILYFSLIGLLGAFLAKGSNEPFGMIYLWLFNHFPGFSMFRDPTKWYTLIALSYAMLIPYTLWKIYERFSSQIKFSVFNFQFTNKSKIINIQNIVIVVVISYLLFLIAPALHGKLSGTFAKHTVTADYQKLAVSLDKSPSFYRTMWMPMTERYAYSSVKHPNISAQDFFMMYDQKKLLAAFAKLTTQKQLEEAGVRYVIIPDDVDHEIFLKDREYSENLYQNTYTALQKVKWLHEVSGYGGIKVFALLDTKSHFWSPDKHMNVSYKMISPVEYTIDIMNAKPGDRLVFAESYDKNWQAIMNDKTLIPPQKFGRLNSFVLQKPGDYTLRVKYEPQKWIIPVILISVITLIIVSLSIISLKAK
ncbi:MAG: hypothetical protein ACREHC_01840 [Candidatus Levyibacteriota bacterium]